MYGKTLNDKLMSTTVYLPLPDWDKREHSFHLYSESTNMVVDPEKFTDEFGYVHRLMNTIVGTEIAFTCCTAVFFLIFVVSLAMYCCKYRKQKNEAAVYH